MIPIICYSSTIPFTSFEQNRMKPTSTEQETRLFLLFFTTCVAVHYTFHPSHQGASPFRVDLIDTTFSKPLHFAQTSFADLETERIELDQITPQIRDEVIRLIRTSR